MKFEWNRKRERADAICDASRWTTLTPRFTGTLLLLLLLTICFDFSSAAASRGYLSTIGPAPLRFEKSNFPSTEDLVIIKLHNPPLLNPGLKTIPQKTSNLVATVKASELDADSNTTTTTTVSSQGTSLKIVVVDRENEQARLRLGLLPSAKVPSANRQRPHFVADLYRRHQV